MLPAHPGILAKGVTVQYHSDVTVTAVSLKTFQVMDLTPVETRQVVAKPIMHE